MTFLSACGGGGGGGDKVGPSAAISPAAQAQGNSYVVTVASLTNVQPSGESTAKGSTATATSPAPGQLLPVLDDNGVPTGKVQQAFTTTVSVSGGNVPPINSGTLSNCQPTNCYEGDAFTRETDVSIDATHRVEGHEVLTLSRYAKTSNGLGSDNSPLQSSFYGAYLQSAITEQGTPDPETGEFINNHETAGRLDLVAVHGGDSTSPQQMASLKSSNVTAQYNGHFVGAALKHGESAFAGPNTGISDVSGDVGLTASFGSGAVTGNAYNLQVEDAAGNPAAAAYGLRMDGSINGSSYSGKTSYTAAAKSQGAPAVGAARGDVIGGFYGINAAETAGVARITGAPTGSGTETLIGSFGAKK